MAELRSELTLPNDLSVQGIARAYAREVAALADLAQDEIEALVRATDEACANVIRHAFEPGESGTFSLNGTLTPTALTLAIRERGLPFDPTSASSRLDHDTRALTRGAVWQRIRHAVDEAHWINQGSEGMELRLTKLRPQSDVTDHLPEAELAPFHPEAAPAPDQTYTIRRLRPEEAIQVSQCVYRAYGYSYGNQDLYYPDRIAHLNETGQWVSIVAVDEAGQVVGHLALERPDLGPVAESGQAVVSPAHRGRHLLERMRAFLEEEAQRLGLKGIAGYPVTSHVFSQRMEEEVKAHACGVALGSMPRSTTFKKITTEPLDQRVSCMLYFKYVAPAERAVVHAPPHHRPMIERVYERLGTPVDLPPGIPAEGPGQVAVSLDRSWGTGEIRVRRVGADTAAEIRRARRDLCETAGAEVVYLDLPLSQPGTPDLCVAAEADGFFFSGVGPCFAPDGDVLSLQYLNVELDIARLQVASPAGQQLVEYVASERTRVGRAGTVS